MLRDTVEGLPSALTPTAWRDALLSEGEHLHEGIEERAIVNILFQETERDLILYLLENPQASQKELSQFARISPSSTNWHMKRLSQAGFVEARRERGFVIYTVKGDPGMILSLLRSYHPRIWDKWAERLADLMT